MAEEKPKTNAEDSPSPKKPADKQESTKKPAVETTAETTAQPSPMPASKPPERSRGKRGRYGDRRHQATPFDKEAWKPRTDVGKRVKDGSILSVDTILDAGEQILEGEIVDVLLPDAASDLLLIGQSKGKFGGGQRRVFKQTQKKTMEGNKPSFATFAIVGDNNGHVGLGYGKARETVPAREKAIRKAKINIMKLRRGCGSWQCSCTEAHSIPFQVEGKCGSVIVRLKPAPKGTGLCAGSEIAKILKLAGVQDVWSKTFGKTTTRINTIKACAAALRQLTEMKVQHNHIQELNIVE